MSAPGRVALGLACGLVALGAVTWLLVLALQREAMEEALAEQGLKVERHIESTIQRLAAEAVGGLESFGVRLGAAARGHPAILDLVIRAPGGEVVSSFSRRDAPTPCLLAMPAATRVDHEHPAGPERSAPVACRSLPVYVKGEHVGDVLFHAERDWAAQSARVGTLVRRTAWRLAPVFLLFYLLLGALLVFAERAARKWRRRAQSAERIEALGAIADGINHEIKNPLNTVGLALQFVGRKHKDADTVQVVASAETETQRIRDTLEEFVRFTGVSRLDVKDVVVGARLSGRVGARVDLSGSARGQVDVEKMDRALLAIADVLERQAPPDGRVRLGFSESDAAWKVVAEAEPASLDAARVQHLFDPYLRSPPCDVGRGLALARAVFQAHGGDLVAQLKGKRLTLRGTAPKVPPGDLA